MIGRKYWTRFDSNEATRSLVLDKQQKVALHLGHFAAFYAALGNQASSDTNNLGPVVKYLKDSKLNITDRLSRFRVLPKKCDVFA